MLTAVLATKLLRSIVSDYNFWPESESDSPLKIATAKATLTNEAILTRDASMRRAALKAVDPNLTGYRAPVREIQTCGLQECFAPHIQSAIAELNAVSNSMGAVESMLLPAQKVEFLVQLQAAFNQLVNPRVVKIIDIAQPAIPEILAQPAVPATATSPAIPAVKGKPAMPAIPADPYTGFMIVGETTDGQTVIAQALLVQT